jgi:hypothetical protein
MCNVCARLMSSMCSWTYKKHIGHGYKRAGVGQNERQNREERYGRLAKKLDTFRCNEIDAMILPNLSRASEAKQKSLFLVGTISIPKIETKMMELSERFEA